MTDDGTWEISVGTHFDAAHRLLDELYKTGTRLHGHTYPVTVRLRGSSLLDHGMLVNHYTLRDVIHRVVGSLHDTCLNDHPALQDLNTTPEVLAHFLWHELRAELDDPQIDGMAVEVGESPNQSVRFEAPYRRSQEDDMPIAVGDRIPDIEVRTMGPDGPLQIRTGDVLGTGTTVLFAVPGAFTRGCSRVHLPGYVERAAELRATGVDTIACIAVNDAYVMHAWGDAHGVGDDIQMLADGNGEFTRAMDMELDGTRAGLGMRSKRYAAVIEDGIVTELGVDEGGTIEASACSAMLARLYAGNDIGT